MNGPYWVLKMMFISSAIIYLIGFVCSKIKFLQNNVIEYLVLIIIIIMLSCNVYPIVSAHLIGMLGAFYEKHGCSEKTWYAVGLIIIAMLMLIMPRNIIASFSFVVLILLTPKVKAFKAFFDGRICQFFGNISWGIYSFHWPSICSVGALWIIGKAGQIGLWETYIIGFFIIFALTVLFAWCFRQTFERMATFITKKLYAVLSVDEKS